MFLSTIRHAWKPSAVLAALLVAGPAFAQVGPPDIDQYLVYQAEPHGFLDYTILLRDQFAPDPLPHFVRDLEFFMNPVEKDALPMVDPRLHYTWWHLQPTPTPVSSVLATNKYGDQQIQLYASEWLLNPALKYPQPGEPIPVANHYQCYRAQGFIPPRPLLLHDQFGTWDAYLSGEIDWWCNPAEKYFDGTVDPIVRPEAHLVCYRIQTPQPVGFAISFLDQFRLDTTQLTQIRYLCVPTFKHDITPTTSASWGSVKATYR
jgi:hypothetical protein